MVGLELDAARRGVTLSFFGEAAPRRCALPFTLRSSRLSSPLRRPVRFSSSVAPALGALDLLDEALQLEDDPVDRLLVETHLLERLDHLRAVGLDLGLDALLARGARHVSSLALFERS